MDDEMDIIIKQIKEQDPELFLQVEKILPFHGYLSTGALMGIQMLNMAKRLLDVKEGERIYVTAETYNCVPDPFQILEGATIGNKGLKVKDYGKMAVTVNKRGAPGETTMPAVRIYLDPEKTKAYPKLYSWYMNIEKHRHEEILPIVLEAGEKIYSYSFTEIEVPIKKRKQVKLCDKCGESFVWYEGEALCEACKHEQ